MLRRQKSDVLADLPPKIIQDYCCELSPLQKMLYEDFAKSRAKKSIESGLEDISKADEKAEKISHIFQVKMTKNYPDLPADFYRQNRVISMIFYFRQFNIYKNCAIILLWS